MSNMYKVKVGGDISKALTEKANKPKVIKSIPSIPTFIRKEESVLESIPSNIDDAPKKKKYSGWKK